MTRIVALDLARFLAVIGMMGAHLLAADSPAALLIAVTGFPSVAFAVFGGVSAILATRRYSADGRHLAAALSLATRGLVIAVFGIVLQPVAAVIYVVLTYFGLALICLALLLRLPAWAMLVVSGALAILGGYLNVGVRTALGAGSDDFGSMSFASPGEFFASLGFTGTYPVVTWLAYMLLGAAIGRMLVAARRPSMRPALLLTVLGAVGVTAAVLGDLLVTGPRHAGEEADGAPVGSGIGFLLDATPHSGSLGDMVRSAAAACLVLGLLLLVTRSGSAVPVVLRPVRAAGAAPLTVYTLHVVNTGLIVIIAFLAGNASIYTRRLDWFLEGPWIWALNILGALVVGAILTALHRRGPLEALVGNIAARVAALSPGSSTRRASLDASA